MNAMMYPRLLQLRLELQASDSSDSFGRSVLLAIRRELLRLLQSVSNPQLQLLPAELRQPVLDARQALQAPAPFPAPSWDVQYIHTEHVLNLLEEVAREQPLPLPTSARPQAPNASTEQ